MLFFFDVKSSIVSIEILLGYYDLIILENYDIILKQETINYLSITEFNQSPRVDDHPNKKQDFHDYLCKIGKDEIGDDPMVDGMNTQNQIKLLKNYLSKQNIIH